MSCFFKLQSSNTPNTKQESMAELAVWHWQRRLHIFLGRNLPTQLCYSSHKCIFLTHVVPFKREGFRLSNGIRFIGKKHCYNNERINQTQISLLFVPSLYIIYTHTHKYTRTVCSNETWFCLSAVGS